MASLVGGPGSVDGAFGRDTSMSKDLSGSLPILGSCQIKGTAMDIMAFQTILAGGTKGVCDRNSLL